MRILTRQQIITAERETIVAGTSALVLMQRAGYAVAQFCLAQFDFRTACVVCGKGNNGGDGLVAAEALSRSAEVRVIILASDATQLSPDAEVMFSRLPVEPIWVPDEKTLASQQVRDALASDLILDAVVGTGFKPPLKGLPLKAVDAINQASAIVVAVDLPSGIDADSTTPDEENTDVARADGIVTFIAPKPAHVFAELTAGPIAVSDIGVNTNASLEEKNSIEVVTGEEVEITFPPRRQQANKGDFGHVLVVAGSCGKAGAAALAGIAALRGGSGLVTVACPRSIQNTVASFAPEMMTEGLPDTDHGTISLAARGKLESLLKGKNVIVIGPGLSQHPETSAFVREVVKNSLLPVVLDADGLNAFDGHYTELRVRRDNAAILVMTPHPGEAARLFGLSIPKIQENRVSTAQRAAKETGACIVLKGSGTVVAGASGQTWINMTGNPAMAKGGSGDVLSGIIGAALARRREQTWDSLPELCVAGAVYLHGLAGDLARDLLHENSVIATDLLDSLAQAFHDCESQAEHELFYLQS